MKSKVMEIIIFQGIIDLWFEAMLIKKTKIRENCQQALFGNMASYASVIF
jgi:hypothetical protein